MTLTVELEPPVKHSFHPASSLTKAVFTYRIRILPSPLKMHKTLISAAASVPTASETSVSRNSWQNRVLFLERYWPTAHLVCTVILTRISNIDNPGLPADLPPKYALDQVPVDSCLNFIFTLFTFCTYTLRCGYIGPLHMLTVPWLCGKNWPKRDAKPNLFCAFTCSLSESSNPSPRVLGRSYPTDLFV